MNDSTSGSWSGENWEIANPADVGMDAARITDAIIFHKDQESDADRDLSKGLMSVLGNTEPPEWAVVLGPTRRARRSEWFNPAPRKTSGRMG